MEGFNKAGLLKTRPISSDIAEIFTPPKDDNCGVLESLRKLNTELPPRVCANPLTFKKAASITTLTFTEYEIRPL